MKDKSKTYTHSIRRVLLDNIEDAKKSILIAMAWFTDNEIKDSLINKKKLSPSIRIEIVVDPNDINRKYFLNYKDKFEEVGIILRKKEVKKFLHHKFMLIDGVISITGSYNYSRKAEMNFEHINWNKSKKAHQKLEKEFRFITNKDYMDENIHILFSYPEFAQPLVSMYYKFTHVEYRKYQKKIILGECYSYPTGSIDKIHYSPGIIFNTEIKFQLDAGLQEFKIPIDKKKVHREINGIHSCFILDAYRDYPHLYHEISGELKKSKKGIERNFAQNLDNTFEPEKIIELIENGIDLIVADYLWLNNFAPYINKGIIAKLFHNFEVVKINRNLDGFYTYDRTNKKYPY